MQIQNSKLIAQFEIEDRKTIVLRGRIDCASEISFFKATKTKASSAIPIH